MRHACGLLVLLVSSNNMVSSPVGGIMCVVFFFLLCVCGHRCPVRAPGGATSDWPATRQGPSVYGIASGGVSARDPNTSGTEALARAIGAVRSEAFVRAWSSPPARTLHSTHAPASRTRTPGRDPGRPRIDPDHDVPAVNNARQARHGPPLSPPAPPHGRTTRTCASAKCMRAVREAWIPLAAHPTQR